MSTPSGVAGESRSSVGRYALVFCHHNWQANTQGGVHKLTEALCRAGFDVDFVSFRRPYFHALTRSQTSGARALARLLVGRHYVVHGQTLYNFTCPTLEVPGTIQRLVTLPRPLVEWMSMATFPSLLQRIKRRRRGYELILLESTPCVRFYPRLRRMFPSARIIYRASDPLPMTEENANPYDLASEREMMREAEAIFLINEESRALYANTYSEIDVHDSRFHILPNGVDLTAFQRPWERPPEYRNRPTAVYVGTLDVCWDLLGYCAKNAPDVDFQIVWPRQLDGEARRIVDSCENLFHIPGVRPTEVPRYVTNADVCIVPYSARLQLKVVRLQAKLLAAMAARKPIVAIRYSPDLAQYGVMLAQTPQDFLEQVRLALGTGPRTYPVDLASLDWTGIQNRFLALLGLQVKTAEPPRTDHGTSD